MQCENISYRFVIYICEFKKEEKKPDCHDCFNFSQSHIHEHNING